LARQGLEVERETRQVHILRLEVIDVRLPYISLEVDCSKGTYVRTLCHDIGEKLGCGAHLTALRRIRSGSFSVDESVTLDELDSPSGHPAFLTLAEALRNHPALEVAPAAVPRLMNGVPPALTETLGCCVAEEGALVALHHDGKLVAVTRFAPSRATEKRGDFELLRVFNTPESP
jgi:tRNA pseudouridine55 synthase